MSGEDFLSLAKSLLKTPTEAAYRSAVSRAYYAVFHVGIAFLAELGLKASEGPQAHAQLRARVNNCGVPELKNTYEQLYDLYKRRRFADYDLNITIFQAQANVALMVASAGQIITTIKQCQQSQALRNQIRNNIREYERKINATHS